MIYRPGTIGIVIDDYSVNAIEKIIEKTTGDGFHTLNYIGDGKIVEALFGQGVVVGKLEKYYDGKSVVLMLEPRKEMFPNFIVDIIVERWKNEIGKKYSNIALLAKKFKCLARLNGDTKRICSELTGYGYEGFYAFLGKSIYDLVPNDILRDQLYQNFNAFIPTILEAE